MVSTKVYTKKKQAPTVFQQLAVRNLFSYEDVGLAYLKLVDAAALLGYTTPEELIAAHLKIVAESIETTRKLALTQLVLDKSNTL